MKRGQRVLIRAYPNKKLLRVVLDEKETYVLVCRPEIYEDVAESETLTESVMGFPKEDIIEVIEGDSLG